jgi:hypothetical protein
MDPKADSVKVRGPTPRDQPSIEIQRLQKAKLMGAYPVIRESSTMQSTLSDDDRVRLFMWGLNEEHRRPSRRSERLPGGNPLTISDSARDYFQYTDTVGDARVQDEKARASLTGKEEQVSPVAPVEKSALVRIGIVLVSGVAVIGAAYFFYRWWKKPGFLFK